MVIRRWATRGLAGGDLTALREIANGSAAPGDPNRVMRLRNRGFVAERKDGTLAITVPGRLALLVKSLTMRH